MTHDSKGQSTTIASYGGAARGRERGDAVREALTLDGSTAHACRFGDIHYLYGPPDAKPRHHRFDKGSYVYLFENASERRCRIEIANHAGTEDQDAFFGCEWRLGRAAARVG